MFSTILKGVSDYFDRRFMLALFFPSLLFWAGLLAIHFSTGGITNAFTAWSKQSVFLQAIQLFVALVWVAFFASLLNSQLFWITRQFEGYWGRPFRWLKEGRIHLYQRKLEQESEYRNVYHFYPMPEAEKDYQKKIMPTRLGNILRNAESYPFLRYDMDAVLFWPRLYPLLPEKFLTSLDAAKAALDLVLVISFLSMLFAFIAGGLVIFISGPVWLFLGCYLGGLLLAWISYTAALGPAFAYSQLIKSAFDLYRGELIKQLGYKAPTSLTQERAVWKNVRQMIYQNARQDPSILLYNNAPAPEQKTTPALPWWQQLWKSLVGTPPTRQPPSKALPSALPSTPQIPAPQPSTEAVPPKKKSRLIDWYAILAAALVLMLAATGVWGLSLRRSPVLVLTPERDLPAYYLVKAGDLKPIRMVTTDLAGSFLSDETEVVGRFTLENLPSGRPVTEAQFVDTNGIQWVQDAVVVSIPDTAAMVYSPQLEPGVHVALWRTPHGKQAEPLLEEALVLDVQEVEQKSDTADSVISQRVILAIPAAQQAEVLTTLASGSLSLTLVP